MRISRQVPAIKSPDLNVINWAAGIFEGEGSLQKVYNSSTKVDVTQKDPWILYKLQEYFGGYVTPRMKANQFGDKICYMHRWIITGARARGFLFTMFPLLSPRRRQQVIAAVDY